MERGWAAPVLQLVRIHPWLRLLRPLQWVKNAVVLAPLVFSREFNTPGTVVAAVGAVLAFCLMSSATYIANDWLDIDRDRHHPTKRTRPLASGKVAVGSALSLAAILAAVSVLLGAMISGWLVTVLASYGGLMVAYSMWLKQIVVLDVIVIAAGFLLRAAAGGVAIGVRLSIWLMVCAALLALFLGFCKRRNELITLVDAASLHRVSLRAYSTRLLDALIFGTAAATILAYLMYTLTAESVPENGAMIITVPLVAFAMLRYLYLVYVRKLGGAPETLLFRDVPLFGAILFWGSAVLFVFWLG